MKISSIQLNQKSKLSESISVTIRYNLLEQLISRKKEEIFYIEYGDKWIHSNGKQLNIYDTLSGTDRLLQQVALSLI